MPGTGFWFFVLIILINVVIGIVRKVAERRAAAEAAREARGEIAPGSGRDDRPQAPADRMISRSEPGRGGGFEVILERAGERRMEVIRVLRNQLGMNLADAMVAAGSTPALIARGLTRSDAGLLRTRFEEVGAAVVVRRDESRSASAAIARMPQEQTSRQQHLQEMRVEELRRRESRGPAIRAESPTRAPTRTRQAAPAPAPPREPAIEVARRAAVPPMPAARSIPGIPAARARDAVIEEQHHRAAILEAVGDRARLQQAFLLAELLRPPVSMRPTGTGGH